MSIVWRAYFTVTRNAIMSSFTYRAHILFQTITSVFSVVILWFLWSAIYTSSGLTVLRGLTFEQTFLYVTMGTALFVLMKTWAEWFMHNQITSGEIIIHFFRPYDLMGWTLFDSLGAVVGNFLTITLPSLLVIFLAFHAPIPDPIQLLFFVPSIVQAYLLSFLFDFAVGVTCFRTKSVWGISTAKEVIILFLSGAVIPLAFFPSAVKDVLLFLPFASMFNTPIQLLVAKVSWEWLWTHLLLQSFWIVSIFALVRWYYALTMKKLIVSGG